MSIFRSKDPAKRYEKAAIKQNKLNEIKNNTPRYNEKKINKLNRKIADQQAIKNAATMELKHRPKSQVNITKNTYNASYSNNKQNSINVTGKFYRKKK